MTAKKMEGILQEDMFEENEEKKTV